MRCRTIYDPLVLGCLHNPKVFLSVEQRLFVIYRGTENGVNDNRKLLVKHIIDFEERKRRTFTRSLTIRCMSDEDVHLSVSNLFATSLEKSLELVRRITTTIISNILTLEFKEVKTVFLYFLFTITKFSTIYIKTMCCAKLIYWAINLLSCFFFRTDEKSLVLKMNDIFFRRRMRGCNVTSW